MQIEIWSDVVCPWCYIGKRRFEAALERVQSGDNAISRPIEIIYRAYQLDPTAPLNSSAPVTEVYAKKFGGIERAEKILTQLTNTAAEDGLEFHMEIAQRSNTIMAHRLLWLAGTQFSSAVQSQLKEEFLQAYFCDGKNVGDSEILIELAIKVLPHKMIDQEYAEYLRSFIASDAGKGEVSEELAMALSHGITGVPTYVINGQWSIPGAQDVETFERVLRRSADRLES